MLAELYDKLLESVRAQNDQRIFHENREPSHVYLIKNALGELQKVYADEPPEHSTALSLVSLTRRLLDVVDEDGIKQDVWFSRECVLATIASGTLNDIRFIPSYTPQFKRLMTMQVDFKYSQAQAYRLLRLELEGVGGLDDAINAIKLVQFNHTQNAAGQVDRGKSSIGQQARSELAGVEKIPPILPLTVEVLENVSGTCQRVRLAIDPDAEAQSFRIFPLPGEIERAIQAAEKTIGTQLMALLSDEAAKELLADIYYGKRS